MTSIFGESVGRILKVEGVSQKQAAMDLGLSRTHLHNIITGKTDPSLSKSQEIARYLGRSLDEMLGGATAMIPNAHQVGELSDGILRQAHAETVRTLSAAGGRPSIDIILAWWRATGGVLESHDFLVPHADIMQAPEQLDTNLEAMSMGVNSLASTTLGTPSNDELQRFWSTLAATQRQKIISEYAASSRKSTILLTRNKVKVRNALPDQVSIDYWRLLVPVTGPDGRNLVINYSIPAGPSLPV